MLSYIVAAALRAKHRKQPTNYCLIFMQNDKLSCDISLTGKITSRDESVVDLFSIQANFCEEQYVREAHARSQQQRGVT